MNKLLVNAPTGAQEVIEVSEGGGYFDNSRVLWDERTDGPLPEITLGGMVREGNALVFSQALLNEALVVKAQADRAAVWEAIKAHRDRLSEQGGYLVNVGGVSKWFHSDQKSKTQQLGLVIMGAGVPPVQWKTLDGSFVTMSQTLANQIFQAGAAQDVGIFAAAEIHKLALMDAAEPATYDFSTGWPSTFGG